MLEKDRKAAIERKADSGNTQRVSFGRRFALQGLVSLPLAVISRSLVAQQLAAPLADELVQLEAVSGGRLGVCVYNALTGEYFGHRLGERFGMCSTFKLPLAAVILHAAERGDFKLTDTISFSKDDLVPYAPVTEQYLDAGEMQIGALAEANQKTSDNVAANLLLGLLGGPDGFTEELRKMGDSTTRLDRFEPDMNFVPAGEERDTTTPLAMAQTMTRFFAGAYLSAESGKLLREWMESTRTGSKRIRAGLPTTWRAGDKTGTAIAEGMPNKYNDVAMIWSQNAPAAVITAYYEADGTYDQMRPRDEEVLRQVGLIAQNAISVR